MKRSILILFGLLNGMLDPAQAAPLSTSFTYQGRLTDNSQLANGTYDFQFRLFDAPTNGAHVPVVLAYPTVAVSNGLFTTELDFGSNVFNGTTWWLEIGLRPSGVPAEFTLLTPRQPLSPVPNALFSVNSALATTAITANGLVANSVSPVHLNTPSAPASGQVLAFDGSGLSWTNAASVAAAWTLNGNNGTTPGANFLGTKDNQSLEFKVNGQRALRLEPNTNGAVNVVGGSPFNLIDAGVIGSTIGGGGAANHPSGLTTSNRISSAFSVIGGGYGNSIQANTTGGFGFATIGGGSLNSIQTDATAGTIAGGNGNTNQTEFGTIGGGGFNVIQYVSYSSTIGGGGFNTIRSRAGLSTIGGGNGNMIDNEANASTVAGGRGNIILSNAFWSSIGGGLQNTIQPDAYRSVIAGGYQNTIQTGSYGSSIGGGVQIAIEANSQSATIGGGLDNAVRAAAQYGTISGGRKNVLGTNASFAAISGGVSNTVTETGGAIGGGQGNQAFSYGAVAGGFGNVAVYSAAIAGGQFNAASPYASVGGGQFNQAVADGCVIGGGNFNWTRGTYNTIGGGDHNNSDGSSSTVGGGIQNWARTNYATVGGGYYNSADADSSFVGGGQNNQASGGAAAIAGGAFNKAAVGSAFIGGGARNSASGLSSSILGGFQNTASGVESVVPGGFSNAAAGMRSLAAGTRAKAQQDGAFVWADSSDFDFASIATNEFAARAIGGVRFVSGVDSNGVPVSGVSLPAGSGSWTTLSDRNAKTRFAPVNPRELLDRVAQLPVQSWNYKSQSESVRHIGPTAQDFHATFNVGEDDQHIATVDADGVALAAIQGLNQKVEENEARIRELEATVRELKQLVGKPHSNKSGGEP